MSEKQTIRIMCQKCGQVIDEPPNINEEEKKPCSNCGSLLRLKEVRIKLDIPVPHYQISGKVKSKETKKPSTEFLQGDDLHHKTGKWNKISRTIDRKMDLYEEVITDPETGQIIHKCEEPLSKHQGHGSAKHKKQDES